MDFRINYELTGLFILHDSDPENTADIFHGLFTYVQKDV